MEKKSNTYLFTSESVSSGHPDKLSDAVVDKLLDEYLARDPYSRVALECIIGADRVVVMGEVTSKAKFNIEQSIRNTINYIGYDRPEMQFDGNTCHIDIYINRQSPDIARGVDAENELDLGAGDQGIIFGYASNVDRTESYIGLELELAHMIVKELNDIRVNHTDLIWYFGPDSKSQVTLVRDSVLNKPVAIDTIVVSTQHVDFSDDETMLNRIREDVKNIVIPRVRERYKDNLSVYNLFWNDDNHIKYHINPTGKFVIGGPVGDTGLVSRKLQVDRYGGATHDGGGGMSGKDPSKVDRCAHYYSRYIAKNCVAAGLCDTIDIQISYAIGVSEPCSIYVNTRNTSFVKLSDAEIAERLGTIFDCRPGAIIQQLKLREPIYFETASYGHMGRTPETVTKTFKNEDGSEFQKTVELFTWEKLDRVDDIKREFFDAY